MTPLRLTIIAIIAIAAATLGFAQDRLRTPVSPQPSPTVSPSPADDPEVLLAELLADKTRNLHQWSAIGRFHGLPSERVNAITQTSDGIMWFATDSGLARFDGRRVAGIASEMLAARRVVEFYPNKDGTMWILTSNGAFFLVGDRFIPVAGTDGIAFTKSRWRFFEDELCIFVNDSTYVRFRRDGAGAPSGSVLPVQRYQLQENYSAPGEILKSNISETSAATDGAWYATRDDGAYFYGGAAGGITHYTLENTAGGLRSNDVLSVFVDREDVVWFGTDKGISRFDPNSPRTEQFASGASSDFIRTIFQDTDGRIFAGTQNGLFQSDKPGEWTPVAGFERRPVYAIAGAPGATVVGTARGLFTIPPTRTKSSDSVRALESFGGKTFAGVFGRGLARVEKDLLSYAFAVPNDALNVTSLRTVGDKLWLGTSDNGAFFFTGREFGSYPALAALRGRAVWSIASTPFGDIWFGTEKGLFLYRGGSLQTIDAESDVRSVTADETGVWCATEKNGLVRFSEDAVFGWIASRFDVEEGLPSQKIFSILNAPDNMLLIGTSRGVVRYRIPSTKPLLVPTRIVSRRLHETSEVRAPIILEFPQNTLGVEVSAINSRTFPEQFQYAFVVRDEKGEIVRKNFGRDPQILIDNLAPGHYSVEIRGFDKNLIASEPLVIELSIGKAPVPWITIALTVLLGVAVVALIWAAISQRRIFQKTRELRQANTELNATRLDLANEAERERRRISRDLHDQTLADLRHLQLLADKLPDGGERLAEASQIRGEIENVSKEIRRICEDLSPSVLENIGFAAALEYALPSFLVSGDGSPAYEFRADGNLDDKIALTSAEQIQIYRIVQEVLSNIARHANAANVILTVTANAARFAMTITDDGDGFDPDARRHDGRGLSNIRSRSSLIGAAIAFTRNAPRGTVFSLEKTISSTPQQTVEIHTS